MNGSDSRRPRRQPAAVITGVLGIFLFIGGTMAVFDVGPDWYHDSVDVASIAILAPLAVLIRQRTAADRNEPPEGNSDR